MNPELLEYLKENLEIFVEVDDESFVSNSKRVRVTLNLEAEEIASDYDTFSVED